jgi:hypothetical protein
MHPLLSLLVVALVVVLVWLVAGRVWPKPGPRAVFLLTAGIWVIILLVKNAFGQGPPLISWVGAVSVVAIALLIAGLYRLHVWRKEPG